MKLISAKISNFRLLKDVKLDFSIDPKKNLTVIRAANETGKTTCLNALVWCLYGSKALPQRGHYSLFPSDEQDVAKKVEIKVEIDFEVELATSSARGSSSVNTRRYTIQRSCYEYSTEKNGQFRDHEIVHLWRIGPNGAELIEDSEVQGIIESTLPESLRNVYFTDGDSAMSFIEAAATQGVKRRRVIGAIESLLGLNILESTIKHLKLVASRFSQEIDNTDYAKEIEELNDKISSYDEDMEEWSIELTQLKEKSKDIDSQLRQVNSKREELLRLGSKKALIDRKNKSQRIVDDQRRNEKLIFKRLSQLGYTDLSMKSLLRKYIITAQNKLNGLNQTKQLPKVNIPILEELLERANCFCGSDLDGMTNEGVSRRDEIRRSIEDSRESDSVQEAATSLYYNLRSVVTEESGQQWNEAYSSLFEELQNCSKTIANTESDLIAIESEIKEMDDSQIEELTRHKERLDKDLRIVLANLSSRSTQIDDVQQRREDAEYALKKLRSKLGKTNNSAFNWDLSKEVREIFTLIVERLKEDEVKKVSKEMNRIFLAMIGQDRAQENATISGAELTAEFDIVVYGQNRRQLNPDQDLNGASRRAITLSFILALTKVSQVEAPNIIDTPLGMMSGYVKQSVLRNIIVEGSQPILFLTHDEIKGVEDILDMYAGVVFTLTNPAHYPTMLSNQPPEGVFGVLRCDCNHHSSCDLCERKLLEL